MDFLSLSRPDAALLFFDGIVMVANTITLSGRLI
jgi:hypothetical protein